MSGVLVSGGSYLQTLNWSGTAPSADVARIVDGGDLHVSGDFRAGTASETAAGVTTLWTATSSDGVMSLTMDAPSSSSTLRLTVRGTSVLTAVENFPTTTVNQWRVGDDVTWECWYRPSDGKSGIRLAVNGVMLPDVTGTATGSALAAPSSVSLGASVANTNYPQRFVAHLKSEAIADTTPEFLVLGDSTVGPMYYLAAQGPSVGTYSPLISVAHDVYTADQRYSRAGIGMFATPSDTTAGQQAKFDASPWSGQSTVKAVIIESGINDRSAGAAVVSGYLQTLVNDVKSKLPTAKVLIAKLVPYTLYDGTTTFLFAINNDIMGSGANPITGTDYQISAHYDALDNGSGGYQSQYNFDNIHENNAGRSVVASAYKGALQALNLLPGGAPAPTPPAGYNLWLHADSLANGAVSSWSSGSPAHTWSQATGANKPTKAAGPNAVTFAKASSQNLTCSDIIVPASTAITLGIRLKFNTLPTGISDWQNILEFATGAGDGFLLACLKGAAGYHNFTFVASTPTAGSVGCDPTLDTTSYHNLIVTWSGTGPQTAASYTAQYDGVSQSITTGSTLVGVSTGMIGGVAGFTQYADIAIQAIVIYPSVLSGANQTALNTYLSSLT